MSLVVKIKLTHHEIKLSEKGHLSNCSSHHLHADLCCGWENKGAAGLTALSLQSKGKPGLLC